MRPLLAVCLMASSALAQSISPVPLSEGAIGRAGRWSANPFVASHGGSFVAVWQEDSRVVIGRAEKTGFTQTASVPAYIPFVRSVVPAGDGFLVVFTTSGGDAALSLNARGEVIGTPHIVVSGHGAVAASNGGDVLVVNEYGDAVILSADGTVRRRDIRVTSDDPYEIRGWAATASRDQFLVAWWTTASEVRTVTLTSSGDLRTTTTIASKEPLWGSISAASDGDQFVVGWRANGMLRAAAVDRNGARAGSPLSVPVAAGYNVDIAWSGSEYWALINEITRLRAIRMDRAVTAASDQVMVDEPTVDHGAQRVAIGGGEMLAVWMSSPFCASSTLVEPAYGQIGMAWTGASPQVVSSGTADEIEPVIAAGGGPPLVLWNEVRDRSRLRAAMLDGVPRTLPAPGDPMLNAAVATDGSGYLAAFVTPRKDCTLQVEVESVDAGGRFEGPSAVGGATVGPSGVYPRATFTPAVAWNGSEYLVAWQAGKTIAAVRVSPAGTVIDPSPVTLVASSEDGALTPRMVWAANRWLLVWLRSYLPYIPLHGNLPTINVISMRSLDRDLRPIGTDHVIATRGWSPAVASDGVTVAVGWRDAVALHGALVDPNDVVRNFAQSPMPRDFGTTLSAAALGGRFYFLDLDLLFVFDGLSLQPFSHLPGTVVASAMASDDQRLVITWSGTSDDQSHRVYATTVGSIPRRRRAVR